MKRKCANCKTEFEFKVKDLELISKNLSNFNLYSINCPFCFTSKEVHYNHRPRHLNDF